MSKGRKPVVGPRIVGVIREKGPLSAKEIAFEAQISVDSAHMTLLKLVRGGEIVRTGEAKQYRYSAA